MKKMKKNSFNSDITENTYATDLLTILFVVLIISEGLVFK